MGLSWQLNWSLLPLVSYGSEKGREGNPDIQAINHGLLGYKKALLSCEQWVQQHIHNPVDIYSRLGFLHWVFFYPPYDLF